MPITTQDMFGSDAVSNPSAGTQATGKTPFDYGNLFGGLGGLAGGLFNMFGSHNTGQAGMDSYRQAQQQLPQYYQPYMQAGQGALGPLGQNSANSMNNPGGMVNQMGENFHQSPGFQFALNQALQGANHAAAAGGMAGSPQAMQQNMGIATQLGNQDYYNYLDRAQNQYGLGQQGEMGLAGLGQQSAQGLSNNIADILNNQAQLQYANNINQQKQGASGIGGVFSGLSDIASMIPW